MLWSGVRTAVLKERLAPFAPGKTDGIAAQNGLECTQRSARDWGD